jgi:sulfate adenylyltransferase
MTASLVRRLVDGDEADAWRAKSQGLPHHRLSLRQLADVECIAVGAFSPLEGFMGRAEYDSVLETMRLRDGTVWPLPIALAVDEEFAAEASQAGAATLTDTHGHPLAVLEVTEEFDADVDREAQLAFGTTDVAHPGVKSLHQGGPHLLAGPITVFERPRHRLFHEYRLDPADTRAFIAERGWRSVVGFQTRNPVHRAHEYLQKIALEIVDGLLLHPLVGETKSDDVPAEVRMRCYEVLLNHYYPRDRVILSVFPAAMRYAGPREAVLHAIARRNYGCTHFIVGRDHAGVGNYYGPFDAQELVRELAPEIGVTALFFDNAFWCNRCGSMATARTCPHPEEAHVVLSGSLVRQMLREGSVPPVEFSRPEVARILIEAAREENP